MAGVGSVKGLSAGTCGNGARLTEIGYADRYGTAALALGRRALGCYQPPGSVAFCLRNAIGHCQAAGRGDAGLENCREIRQMWASTSSHADCPEGNDDTIVQDCPCGYHGLMLWLGGQGALAQKSGGMSRSVAKTAVS